MENVFSKQTAELIPSKKLVRTKVSRRGRDPIIVPLNTGGLQKVDEERLLSQPQKNPSTGASIRQHGSGPPLLSRP